MSDHQFGDAPHRRLNPLTGEWILVSPHRTRRPWQGRLEGAPVEKRATYDPHCYLCPGNERAGGVRNPTYTRTLVFENDFAALLPDIPAGEVNTEGLLIAHAERGLCRVICFSPDHSLTLAQMAEAEIRAVIEVWRAQYEEIGALPYINYVQVFENKGEIMGCSNPHPHGQIWANETVPQQPALEQIHLAGYLMQRGRCLLCDYLALELRSGERVVAMNEHWVALVPYWATWPFEALLISREHLGSLAELRPDDAQALANVLKRVTTRYDNLFLCSFPYTMGIHQQPTDGQRHPEWHMHLHFYPPLLRSAMVRKFMVGYEMLANPQRDLTPEAAADRLRRLSEVRFDLA